MAETATSTHAPAAHAPDAHNPLTFTLTPGMAPAAPLMRLLARFDREKVEAFAEVSIALLDLIDGDPDVEDDDPAEEVGDEEDAAWTEFHTRGRHKLAVGNSEPFDRAGEDCEEDDAAEDDDPAGQCDEDGVNTGGGEFWVHAMQGAGPGCPISDPGEFADGL